MSKCRLTSAHLVFGLMTFVCTATAAPPSTGVNKHCVVRLESAESDASQSVTPPQPECYPTFRDAIFFATGGRILLPSKEPFSVQLEILGQELKARQKELTAAASYVVATDYEHINYGGYSLNWVSGGPCTPNLGGGWQTNSYSSSWWNDRVSSTRGYSECDRNILWEHVNRQGVKQTCTPNCSSLGWMNDRTSSREWHHRCEGVSGMWSGCPYPNGCQVCAELVANYPCYFQNHPNCSSNGSCGGLYFACSNDCPAPTQADTCAPPPTCSVGASCANAGGGWVYCEGSCESVYAVDDCYASCDGQLFYCPNAPPGCPF
jgi:hypothetical protein